MYVFVYMYIVLYLIICSVYIYIYMYVQYMTLATCTIVTTGDFLTRQPRFNDSARFFDPKPN